MTTGLNVGLGIVAALVTVLVVELVQIAYRAIKRRRDRKRTAALFAGWRPLDAYVYSPDSPAAPVERHTLAEWERELLEAGGGR